MSFLNRNGNVFQNPITETKTLTLNSDKAKKELSWAPSWCTKQSIEFLGYFYGSHRILLTIKELIVCWIDKHPFFDKVTCFNRDFNALLPR